MLITMKEVLTAQEEYQEIYKADYLPPMTCLYLGRLERALKLREALGLYVEQHGDSLRARIIDQQISQSIFGGLRILNRLGGCEVEIAMVMGKTMEEYEKQLVKV